MIYLLVFGACESGRLVRTITVTSYTPWCCEGESYVSHNDLTTDDIAVMQGKYVTVAPGSIQSLEYPTSAFLIENSMVLDVRQVEASSGDFDSGPSDATADVNNIYLSYSSYPSHYPVGESELATLNFSIGANTNNAIYGSRVPTGSPAVMRVYVNECEYPPAAPPPPPAQAMCTEGYWPLYQTAFEASGLSPSNTSHTHVFHETTYYMPDSFVGAIHDGTCPSHASGLPPLIPPSPHPPPLEPPPPYPPSPPSPPPPWQMPIATRVTLLFVGPALLLVLGTAWSIYYYISHFGHKAATTTTSRPSNSGIPYYRPML